MLHEVYHVIYTIYIGDSSQILAVGGTCLRKWMWIYDWISPQCHWNDRLAMRCVCKAPLFRGFMPPYHDTLQRKALKLSIFACIFDRGKMPEVSLSNWALAVVFVPLESAYQGKGLWCACSYVFYFNNLIITFSNKAPRLKSFFDKKRHGRNCQINAAYTFGLTVLYKKK